MPIIEEIQDEEVQDIWVVGDSTPATDVDDGM